MNKTVSVSLITAAAAVSALAHDADTLAFYAFKEGAAETSLSGVTIANDVGEAFAGTVNLASGADDTMVYKADAPGAYVFDCNGYCATPLCSNPQSVYFAGGTTAANQRISFADLASAISSNDNYTVEFFVKLSPEDKATVENEIAAFKKTRESNNAAEIKSAMDELTQKVYAIFGKLYQQQGGQPGPDMGAQGYQQPPQQGGQNADGSYDVDGTVE